METWLQLLTFVSDLRLSPLWLILSNFFPCTYPKQRLHVWPVEGTVV